MATVLGKNVFIYSGNSGTSPIIAMAKTCTVRLSSDMIEKASSTNSDYKEYIAGRKEWAVSLNHLVSSAAPFEGLLKVGETYTLSIMIGTTRKVGTAICQEAEIQASVGNLAAGSVKFQGSGALT